MSAAAASVHHTIDAVNVLDAQSLLSSFGTIGLAVVLGLETGLLIGLFLPGDSLLPIAAMIIAISLVPVALELRRERSRRVSLET